MLRATVLLVAALALAGCADLGDWPASAPAPGADAAPDAATPPIAADSAPPAPVAAAVPAPAPTPPPAMREADPPARAAPEVAPGIGPPPTAALAALPGPAGGACAAVTGDGPAREIDLDRVRLLLRGGDYRRGAFETNASYRTRSRAKLESIEALAAEQTGRADLVFSLPIPAYRLTYDADTHELWIGSELGLLRGGSAIGMGDFVLVSSSERQIGRHVSTIAYGSRATPPITQEVAKITGDQLGIVLPGGSSIGWPSNFERLHVPMTPAEAAAAKPALAVLFVGRLVEPYFITGEFLQEPKRDDPVEKRLTVEALKLAVDCAAVYDRRSGRVIRQILPAGPDRR
jgi:hypothetical protein